MMTWYAESLARYPDGLVSQAQAATMLGLSRVAISRLVARGYLRAVYFPKPPDIVGVAVGQDDPTWLKIIGWLGDFDKTYAFPKACFVSFGDVVELWKSGEAKKKCKRDWNEIMANFLSKEPSLQTNERNPCRKSKKCRVRTRNSRVLRVKLDPPTGTLQRRGKEGSQGNLGTLVSLVSAKRILVCLFN